MTASTKSKTDRAEVVSNLPRGAGPTRIDNAADEDAQLLWQAAVRAETLLDDLAAGRSSAPALAALLGYLREVVLTRIAEEEGLLVLASGQAGASHPDIDRVRDEHLLLRDNIDDLAAAADGHSPHDPGGLAEVTRRLISGLEEHLRHEAAALAESPSGQQGSASSWAAAAHWYPLTEGPLIDLDQLHPDQAEDAVLNRLANLLPDESVELRGHDDPHHLWQRLQLRCPGSHGWRPRRDEHDGWIVSVTRRHLD